jgi:hypothetical protein
MVNVSRYFAVPKGWQPERPATQVIATLRNGAPLVVEGKFGDGRVVAFLTSAAPTWNNWARNNPSFVVAMLELQAFLAGQAKDDASRLVGSPIALELDPAVYEPQVRLSGPDQGGPPPLTADAVPTAGGSLAVSLVGTDRSGIYTARLRRTDGTTEERFFAINVDPQEGDLKALDGPALAARLQGIHYEYAQAAGFQAAAEDLAGFNLSEPLLYLLVVLLIAEQVLAWSASYHPPAFRRRRTEGGAP